MTIEDIEIRQLRQRALELALQYMAYTGGDAIAHAKAFERYMLGTEDVSPQATLKAA